MEMTYRNQRPAKTHVKRTLCSHSQVSPISTARHHRHHLQNRISKIRTRVLRMKPLNMRIHLVEQHHLEVKHILYNRSPVSPTCNARHQDRLPRTKKLLTNCTLNLNDASTHSLQESLGIGSARHILCNRHTKVLYTIHDLIRMSAHGRPPENRKSRPNTPPKTRSSCHRRKNARQFRSNHRCLPRWDRRQIVRIAHRAEGRLA